MQATQLQDTLATYTKKITLRLDANSLDQQLLTFLDNLFKENKGDHKVDMMFYETEEQLKLVTTSRKLKVHVGESLLTALDEYPVSYKLN